MVKIVRIGSSQAGQPPDWKPIPGYEFDYKSYPGETTEALVKLFKKHITSDYLAPFDEIWIFAGSNDAGTEMKHSHDLLSYAMKCRANKSTPIW